MKLAEKKVLPDLKGAHYLREGVILQRIGVFLTLVVALVTQHRDA